MKKTSVNEQIDEDGGESNADLMKTGDDLKAASKMIENLGFSLRDISPWEGDDGTEQVWLFTRDNS